MFICVLFNCIYQSNTDRDVFEEMKSAREDGSLDSILVRESLVYRYVALQPFVDPDIYFQLLLGALYAFYPFLWEGFVFF